MPPPALPPPAAPPPPAPLLLDAPPPALPPAEGEGLAAGGVLVVEPAPELLLLAFGGFELPDELLLPEPELSQPARPNAASNAPATSHFRSIPFSFPFRRQGPDKLRACSVIRQ